MFVRSGLLHAPGHKNCLECLDGPNGVTKYLGIKLHLIVAVSQRAIKFSLENKVYKYRHVPSEHTSTHSCLSRGTTYSVSASFPDRGSHAACSVALQSH